MKRSSDYYLKRLTQCVEDIRQGKNIDLHTLSEDTTLGMKSVLDDYLFSKWLFLGDTAFNREGYRNATDLIIEHLKSCG